ncbi:hypothetical protein LUW77_03245 [Streptomyces radiopugnans]|nr:hypothetical protein LUW77_03245 [Streptomyces radiopugnans]
MSRKPAAPMPAEIRSLLRAKQHPARSVPCPHCGAAEHRPCVVRANARRLPQPHPARVTAWARATAVCPACQVEPGIECHLGGRPLRDGRVHPQREAEARRAAA